KLLNVSSLINYELLLTIGHRTTMIFRGWLICFDEFYLYQYGYG
ncbi:6292_t:CDS:1, partial [Cetraspora pellucida]